MNKEAILQEKLYPNVSKEFYDTWVSKNGHGDFIRDAIDAMDEWAVYRSVQFAEWADEQGWDKHIGENTWFNRMGYATEYTTGQLYELFLKSKS